MGSEEGYTWNFGQDLKQIEEGVATNDNEMFHCSPKLTNHMIVSQHYRLSNGVCALANRGGTPLNLPSKDEKIKFQNQMQVPT
jgi:hypothetical protein